MPLSPFLVILIDRPDTETFDNTDWPSHSSELEDHNSGSSDFPFMDTARDKLY